MARHPQSPLTALALASVPLLRLPGALSVLEASKRARAEGAQAIAVGAEDGAIQGGCVATALEQFDPGETLEEAMGTGTVVLVAAETPVEAVLAKWEESPGACLVVVGAGGEVLGLIDPCVTSRRLGEVLAAERAKLAAVLETVNEAVTIVDAREVVVGWNRKAEEIYGIRTDQILGRPIRSMPAFQDLMVTRVMSSGEAVRDAYLQSAEGTYVLINAHPVRRGGRVVGGVSAERDITELVSLHQELSEASSRVKMLERKGQRKDEGRGAFGGILGNNPKLRQTITLARRVAKTDASVLVRGESGTGKELFAEAIHRASRRGDGPFVVINCGAIPPTLFESEVFGYHAGAFTGADRRGRTGKFELAHGGTVFLDEVGELGTDLQVKLLRVLQDRVVTRVGGDDPVRVDVRIVAATHRDLEEMIGQGLFREDLYYRLNVVSLEIPPLRRRRDDIPLLVHAFLQEFSRLHDRKIERVAPEVLSALLRHEWSGNVRELRNAVERLVVLSEGPLITGEHLPRSLQVDGDREKPRTSLLAQLTDQTERELISGALEQTGHNMAQAARLLGIPRSTLYYKVRHLDLAGDRVSKI